MERRTLLKSLPVLAATTSMTKVMAQAAASSTDTSPAPPPPYKGRLEAGVVALSYWNQLASGEMTYEDAVVATADVGLKGMDMTGYWVPPLLKFPPGVPSHTVSEMVRATPANPSHQWLTSLRRTAYRNGIPIYSVGSPVKMGQPTPELRQHEIAFAKKWVDIAYELGAGHLRVFAGAGNYPQGTTEEQVDAWAIEVYKPVLEYAVDKGLVVGIEDDDEYTRSSAQLLRLMKMADNPNARINCDVGNFRKDGYAEVGRVVPYMAATHVKLAMTTPEGTREKADWVKLFGILANGGYRGFVSIELEPKKEGGNEVAKYAPELIRCARMFSGGPA